MKISYKSDYALKAMLDLAIHYNVELVSNNDLAKRIDAPIKFMEQVLLELRKSGLIESRRGNEGGYTLSRPPAKITVGEVIRCIDGSLEPISCLKQEYTNCHDIDHCVFKKIWQEVHQAISGVVDNVTFGELVAQVQSSRQSPSYDI